MLITRKGYDKKKQLFGVVSKAGLMSKAVLVSLVY